MRKDIELELKGAETRGQREATVAFTISYQGGDPTTVALVTNTLASFYIEENLKARERQAAGTAEFLKAQLAETKQRLDEQEQRESEFKRRHIGELPQQMEANLGTLERLHTQLRLNADNQTRATERRQALSNQLAEAESLLATPALAAPVGGSGRPPSRSETIEARLAKSKEELAKLRTRFSDKYPDVVLLAAEISALERELERADLRGQQDDVRVFVAEPGTELCQLLLRLGQARLDGLGPGGGPARPADRGGEGRGGEERFGFRQLIRQRLASFRASRLIVGVQAELRVEPFEGAEIRLHLLGQLTDVAPLELALALLLLVEPLLRFRELRLEKLRGARGLALTGLQVLLDIEGREGVRHERDRGRIAPLVTDREGHRGLALAARLRALELEPNVLAHPLDDIFGCDALPQIGVEAEAADQGFQPRAAQNLLADRVEPSLERAGHGGLHEGLRNLLAVHEHGGRGPVDVRQEGGEADARRQREGEGEDGKPLPPAPDLEQCIQAGSFPCLFRHGLIAPDSEIFTAPGRCRRCGGKSSPARRRPCCS